MKRIEVTKGEIFQVVVPVALKCNIPFFFNEQMISRGVGGYLKVVHKTASYFTCTNLFKGIKSYFKQ